MKTIKKTALIATCFMGLWSCSQAGILDVVTEFCINHPKLAASLAFAPAAVASAYGAHQALPGKKQHDGSKETVKWVLGRLQNWNIIEKTATVTAYEGAIQPCIDACVTGCGLLGGLAASYVTYLGLKAYVA